MADQGFAVARNAAHCSDARRRAVQAVDELRDFRLVRHGDVESIDAERAQAVHRWLQILRRDAAGGVHGVHPEQRECARVDRGRPRVRDGIAEEDEKLSHQASSSTSAPSERNRSKKPGNETSAHSAPEITVGESAARAATENASAMR